MVSIFFVSRFVFLWFLGAFLVGFRFFFLVSSCFFRAFFFFNRCLFVVSRCFFCGF